MGVMSYTGANENGWALSVKQAWLPLCISVLPIKVPKAQRKHASSRAKLVMTPF